MAQYNGLLNSPLLGMGIGLLSGGDVGGTLASGAQQGLANAMMMQRRNQNAQIAMAQLRAANQKYAQRQAQAQAISGMMQQRQGLIPVAQGQAGPPQLGMLPPLLSPQQGAMATAFPEKFASEYMDDIFEGADTPSFTDIAALRKEYTASPATKRFTQLTEAYEKINAADPTAAGDMSLTYGYMKLLDPTSTVMQGEQASVANAAGVPERIRAIYNQAIEGTTLTDVTRADFKRQAKGIMASQIPAQLKREARYQTLAKEFKIPKAQAVPDVIGDYRTFIKKPKSAVTASPAPTGLTQEAITAEIERRKKVGTWTGG